MVVYTAYEIKTMIIRRHTNPMQYEYDTGKYKSATHVPPNNYISVSHTVYITYLNCNMYIKNRKIVFNIHSFNINILFYINTEGIFVFCVFFCTL